MNNGGSIALKERLDNIIKRNNQKSTRFGQWFIISYIHGTNIVEPME